MDQLPDPLTPPGCDLSDFQYMELDVRRLRDSRFSASVDGEAFRAGILLWCAAWHQVPAASLPDDDVELANLAGYGRVVKEWKKVRAEALHGFVKCSDGRLYHKVIAEKAMAASASKERFTYNKFTDRLRKDNHKRVKDGLLPSGIPTIEQWNSGEYPHGIPPENLKIPAETKQVSAGIPPENALRGNCRGNGTVEGDVLIPIPGAKAPSSPAKLPTCPTQSVIDLYHEILPNLPKVRLHTKDRVKAIRKVWDWALTSLKPDHGRRAETAEQALEWFRSYFERSTDNDFLMGRGSNSGSHATWQCDLDFLLTDKGMKHVIEKTREAA